jgi:hypothetical protein
MWPVVLLHEVQYDLKKKIVYVLKSPILASRHPLSRKADRACAHSILQISFNPADILLKRKLLIFSTVGFGIFFHPQLSEL